jgi:aminoglycoside phosphotransferase (APT) family kinase protein
MDWCSHPRGSLAPVDRPSWEPKTSDKEEYVMIHGDLGPHNVMMDLETLEVVSIVDWEYSGYFPPEFQKWGATRRGHFAHFDDEDLARKLAASIDP